jgi:C1A family cysteine protease
MNRIKSRKYGWRRDLPDHRDFVLQFSEAAPLPSGVDLKSVLPAVYDQGQLGSCTANAIAGAIEFNQSKENIERFPPSRLFLYYNERAMEGSANSDSGATLRDGMRTVYKVGVCRETVWPYDPKEVLVKPPVACYREAGAHRSVYYAHVPQTIEYMRTCLATGYPFVFGFSVYDSFESLEVAQTGVVPMPGSGESLLGGHAVLAVGYDDASQRFLVRNSWGADWGQDGYFTMPYEYLENPNLTADLWTLRVMG